MSSSDRTKSFPELYRQFTRQVPRKITSSAWRVLSILYSHVNQQGDDIVYPGMNSLLECTGLSERAAQRALETLSDAGYVTPVGMQTHGKYPATRRRHINFQKLAEDRAAEDRAAEDRAAEDRAAEDRALGVGVSSDTPEDTGSFRGRGQDVMDDTCGVSQVTPGGVSQVTPKPRELNQEKKPRERACADAPSPALDDLNRKAAQKPKSDPKPSEPRGTRLDPEKWNPGPDGAKFARERGVDHREEWEKFKDYWTALPNPRGCKLDWQATWRTWVRTAQEDGRGSYGLRTKL